MQFEQQAANKEIAVPSLLLMDFLPILFALASLPPVIRGASLHGSQLKNLTTDPEAFMNVTELILSKGYPCEEHSVTTDDGYILGLQRIPHGVTGRQRVYYSEEDKPVVLLQHGLISCSACWVENLVNESLGFILADNGMDVWLGNSRGNTYSRKHISLDPDNIKFWEWSWDEMAKYDLPAMINRILSTTKKSHIYYIGHSQGTEIAFAGFGQDWNRDDKIKEFYALAPVASVGHMKSPLRLLAPFANPIKGFFDLFGEGEFLPSTEEIRWLGREVCGRKVLDLICENLLFVLGGYDFEQMNVTRLPVYLAHYPAGTSVQNMVHYAQSVNHGQFKMYDFGCPEKNMQHYNQTTPPLYDPSIMRTPVVLYTATNDWLSDPRDVNALIPELSYIAGVKNINHWNHLDFIWAMDAPQQIYNDIVSRITASVNRERNSSKR